MLKTEGTQTSGLVTPLNRAASDAFDRQSERCLDGQIMHLSQYPVACGGHADIWNGQLANRGVAVKVMRPWSNSGRPIQEDKLLRRLWREYSAWSSLSHPNVLELFGFSYDFSPDWFAFPSLVSPWMSNGTVESYIESQHITNRLRLLVGIAEGLLYLHTREPAIIHGDLRAGNVLVSDSGVPCISDFGLSRVLSETRKTPTSTDPAGSLRWMSPELFRDDSGVSVHSDVWAYGMTMLEVVTGNRPYSTSKSDAYVFGQINDGRTPSRPKHSVLTDELWLLCCQCWSFKPSKRPSMDEVITKISGFSEHLSYGDGIMRADSSRSSAESTHLLPNSNPIAPIQTYGLATLGGSSQNHKRRDTSTETSTMEPARKLVLTTQKDPPNSGPSTGIPRSPQEPRENVTDRGGNLRDLAGLVGIPRLQHSVDVLFQCYEALNKMKVCKHQCQELHTRCVKLLLDLERENAQAGADEAETIIVYFSCMVNIWSTWNTLRSYLRKSEIKDGLRRLNEAFFQHYYIVAAYQTGPRFYRRVDAMIVVEAEREPLRLQPLMSPLNMRIESSGLSLPVSYQSPPSVHSASSASLPGSVGSVDLNGIQPGRSWSTNLFPEDDERCLDGRIIRFSSQPSELGRYADIRQGNFSDQPIAIKTIRLFHHTGTQMRKRIILERLWRKYTSSPPPHPNVLRYLWFFYDPPSALFPSLVSPWMANGTLSSYLQNNPEIETYELVLGVARGLSHLHAQDPPIVHGDLRTENILVSDSGVPCLSDLRLSEIIDPEGVHTPADIVESLRWMSPEILRYDASPDLRSDVWAYGMTVLETISRSLPYQDVKGPAAVFRKIREGEIPSRPASILSDTMWAICLRCWIVDERQRPLMHDVLSELVMIATPQTDVPPR